MHLAEGQLNTFIKLLTLTAYSQVDYWSNSMGCMTCMWCENSASYNKFFTPVSILWCIILLLQEST